MKRTVALIGVVVAVWIGVWAMRGPWTSEGLASNVVGPDQEVAEPSTAAAGEGDQGGEAPDPGAPRRAQQPLQMLAARRPETVTSPGMVAGVMAWRIGGGSRPSMTMAVTANSSPVVGGDCASPSSASANQVPSAWTVAGASCVKIWPPADGAVG